MSEPKAGMRLDLALVARGLAPSRSRAQDLIRRGFVTVDRQVIQRPGHMVSVNSGLALADGAPTYVSRGAEKLAAGLEHFGFDPAGRVVLDVGASTGGFTELVLERGAARVYAVDVGAGQLHERLKAEPRVISLEERDARDLDRNCVPEAVGAFVADVSFISLTKALGPALELAGSGAWLIALVKPQFEAGRAAIGKGGIVGDEADRERAVAAVSHWIGGLPGWRVAGVVPSPVAGRDGNQEFLLGANFDGQ